MSKYRIHLIAISLIVLVAFLAAGCAGQATTTTTIAPATTASGAVKAVFINQDMVNASQAFAQQEFLKYDADYGLEVSVMDSKGDVKTEAELIASSVAQGVKVIFINPNDMQASAAALKQAKEAGVIIGLFSSDLSKENQAYRDFSCTVDDVEAGRQAAQAFIKQFPDGATIVEIGGQMHHGAQINRHAGFNEALAGSNIKVIDYQATQLWDAGQAMAIMETMMARHGDQIQGVFCHWDNGCSGVITALKAADRLDGMFLVGVDGNQNGFNQIKNGEQSVTLAQDFTDMAKKSMELARAILDGKQVESINWIPLDLVTKDNIDQFPMPKW